METEQILKLEEKTLKDLYELSIKQVEVAKLKREIRTIENDMFTILASLADSMSEILKMKEMRNLREIIEQHQFVELIADSKKALESVNRDFIENMESRVRIFENDITKLSQLYNVHDYRRIEELENIEEKLKLEHEYGFKDPIYALLSLLMWNSRVLRNCLSSRAVWLSYKKP